MLPARNSDLSQNNSLGNGESEPVFQAPWEATAFAIVNQLAATGQFTWGEWTTQLSKGISLAEAESPENSSYYKNWVSACEKILISKGLLEPDVIAQKIEEIIAEREQDHH
ncbi:nitrile hydratase accessory protein [cf. Phormidesmis sp. LEGE 11477]|uniref:nitrile hydratase accessory protein n=1 Tax=cf. Phormidesmis sp. LEGE 11477 TaxID=1828680 RepID=UPI00187EAF5A|nr:nitrile hydratase accessory protein [cf. Phormidesmis sp. LEGE 11477]MBE9061386.1 nitrile hydratase accessory protein [cf. Phormidesmis sp. LEGE 11477]